MSTTRRSSSNIDACQTASPSGETTMLPPSKTSSSCPPTAFTYTIHAPVSRARSRQISRRSAILCRWYGYALMFGLTPTWSSPYRFHGARELLERVQIVLHEPVPQHEVLRRIARDRELREADERRSGRGGAGRPLGHLGGVPVEVADGRVDLSQRDANHRRKRTREDADTRSDLRVPIA